VRARDRFGVAGIAGIMGLVSLAFGGAVRWAAVTASLGALAIALGFVRSRRVTWRSPVMLLLVIAIAATALQLVPLPLAIADVIAPDKLELVTAHARAWHESPPAFVMASFDPPATLVELAKLVGYAALAFAALRIARERDGQRALAMIVVGAGVLVAVLTLAHTALGAHAIYGLVDPPARQPLLSPIINGNHLAALMTLAVPVALALALSGRRAVVWIGAAIVCAGTCLATGSRSGLLGLALGVGLTAIFVLLQRSRRISLPAVVIASCVVTLLVVVAARGVIDELRATHLDSLASDPHWKVQTWKRALGMLGEHPWLGTGRGAFEPAFTRWASAGDTAFSHVENTYLQALIDWGIVPAIALAAALAAFVTRAARRWRHSPLEAAAFAALVALGAHELADFSLELPVVAMAAILLAAILLPVDAEAAARQRRRPILLAVGVGVCALAASPLAQLPHASAEELSPGASVEDARTIAARHLADFLVVGRAASVLAARGDPRAAEVLSRALFLAPHHAGLHRFAATLLLRAQQPEQAASELARAVQDAPNTMLPDLLEQIVATFPDPATAGLALPIDPVLEPKVYDLIAKHPPVAFEYARRVAMFAPDDAQAQLYLARAALVTDHPADALEAASDAYGIAPSTASGIVLARAQAATHDVTGAIATLTNIDAGGLSITRDDRVTLLSTLAELELSHDELTTAAATLDRLGQLAEDRRARIAFHRTRALLHDRLGETRQAEWDRAEARRLETEP
jgi:O-antigen ligase